MPMTNPRAIAIMPHDRAIMHRIRHLFVGGLCEGMVSTLHLQRRGDQSRLANGTVMLISNQDHTPPLAS